MNSDQSGLAGRLKKLADEAGGTTALARICGMPQRTMANYTDGKTEPRASDVVKIAKQTRVRLDWLLIGEGEMRTGYNKDVSQSIPTLPGADPDQPIPMIPDLLEGTVEGVEIGLERRGIILTPEQKSRMVSALYGINYRRHLIRTAGGTLPMVEGEDTPETMAPDVADLIRLIREGKRQK